MEMDYASQRLILRSLLEEHHYGFVEGLFS